MSLELEQEINRAGSSISLLYANATTILSSSLVMLRSLPPIDWIEYSTSFCFSNAARISGTVVPSVLILFTVRLMVKYS